MDGRTDALILEADPDNSGWVSDKYFQRLIKASNPFSNLSQLAFERTKAAEEATNKVWGELWELHA